MTNGIEEPERRRGPVVQEVTGYVSLQPGQGFYEQFPFDEVLPLLAGQYTTWAGGDIPIDEVVKDLRLVITDKAKTLRGSRGRYSVYKPERAEKYQGDSFYHLEKALYSELHFFTDWEEYVDTQLERAYYELDGRYQPRGRNVTAAGLPRTYLGWLEDRVVRDRRIQRGLILQGEPHLLGDAPTASPDASDAMRTWRVARRRVPRSNR